MNSSSPLNLLYISNAATVNNDHVFNSFLPRLVAFLHVGTEKKLG